MATKFNLNEIISDFKQKMTFENIAILGILSFLFAFSAFLLTRANLHFLEFFDISRADIVAGKFVSVYSILFLLMFSATIAVQAILSYRIGKYALISFPITFIISLVFFALTSIYLAQVFVAFSIFLLGLGYFAAGVKKEDQKSFWKFWDVFGKSLMILVFAGFILTAMRVSEQKSLIFSEIISSSYDSMGGVRQEAVNTCANLVANASIPNSVVESYLNSSVMYSLLNQTEKDAMLLQTSQMLKSGLKSISDAMKSQNVADIKLNQTEIAMVTEVAKGLPMVDVFYNYMEFAIALIVATMVSSLNFVIKLIASILAYLLTKL